MKKRIKKITIHPFAKQLLLRFIGVFLIVCIAVALFLRLTSKPAVAEWFDSNWLYRQRVDVTNASGSTLTDFQSRISIDTATLITAGKMQSDCDDIRIISVSGTTLPHWIEGPASGTGGCNNATTYIWTKIPSIPTSGATVFVYYGNSTIHNIENGNSVFEFFDDFEQSTIDSKKWIEAVGTSGQVQGITSTQAYEGSNSVQSYQTADSGDTYIMHKYPSSTSRVIELEFYDDTTIPGGNIILAGTGFLEYNQVGVYTSTSTTHYVTRSGGVIAATSVARATGWHKFRWVHNGTNTVVSIDGTTVNTFSGGFSTVDSITFGVYHSASAGFYADNAFSRKYASTDPTTTPASEEAGPGAVAYWSMNEGQGQTVNDGTVNNNDGTLGANSGSASDDPTWQTEDQCISGKCLSFDGTNDYILTTNNSNFNATSNTISVTGWVKPTNSAIQVIASKGGSTAGGWYIANSATNQVFIVLKNGSADGVTYATSADSIPLNKWTHIVVNITIDTSTLGNNNIEVFINGNLANGNITRTSLPTLSTAKTKLGARGEDGSTSLFWPGKLDEVKIYPYARTPTQVKSDFQKSTTAIGSAAVMGQQDTAYLNDGLVGYWKMDEISGTTVADASGNSNTGTLTNAQEAGTADGSGGSTTTLIDSDGSLSATDDVYNGLVLRVTAICGSITANTDRLISDYNGTTKTITVTDAYDSTLDSCQYIILHQTTGKFSNSVSFDGTDDYVTMGDPSSGILDFGTGDFSVSYWANLPNTALTGRLVSKRPGTTGAGWSVGSAAGAGTGNFNFRIDDGTNNNESTCATAIGVIGTGWHHFVATFTRANNLHCYVDGQLVGSINISTINGSLSNSSPFNINGYNDANTGNNDLIDDVRMYNRSLSGREVASLYNWAPGPVGHFKFDDGSGSTPVDSSGNGFNGTLAGGTWNVGKFGKALTFDGSATNYVQLPVNNSLAFHYKNYTVSAWINPQTTAGTQYFVARASSSSPNKEYSLHVAGSDFTAQNWGVGGSTASNCATTGDIIRVNTWTYVTYVYNNGYSYCYVNGKLENRSASQFTGTREGGYIRETRIGMRTSFASNNFNGSIDDVRFYDYARTPGQIVEDMNSGHPIGGSPISSKLVDFKFNEQQGQAVNNIGIGGSSFNGTLGASAASASDDPLWKTGAECKDNGCLQFDGSNDYVALPDDSVDSHSVGSICTWAYYDKPTDDGTQGALFSFSDNASLDYKHSFYISDTGSDVAKIRAVLRVNTSSNQIDYTTGDNSIARQSWNHYCFTQAGDGTGVKLYINGKPTTFTPSISGTATVNDWFDDIATNAEEVTIGNIQDNSADSFFTGKIDNFHLYNTALTADQVKTEMNAGATLNFGTASASESALLSDGPGNPPIAYWNLDERSGTAANDKSGNGYTGTLTNGPTWDTGKFGSSVKFDGSNDYIDTADINTIDGASRVTYSAWVYINTLSDYQAIMSKRFSGTNGTLMSLGGSFDGGSNDVLLSIRNGTDDFGYTTGNIIQAGVWQHWTMVYDGTLSGNANRLKFFLNGQQQTLTFGASTIPATTGSNSSNVYLGFEQGVSASYLNGKIDDAKIYDYALTQAQVAYNYNRGEPIGWWKLNECQGTTIYDNSGNGNNGTWSGTGAGSQTAVGTCNTSSTAWGNGATGKFNASLNFDGTDDYVSMGDPANGSLDFGTGNMTVSAWFKTSTSGSAISIVDKKNGGAGGTRGYNLLVNASGFAQFRTNTDATNNDVATGATSVTDNVWHLITGVLTRGTTDTISLYVDGKFIRTTTTTTPGGTIDSSQNLVIGTISGLSASYFPGQIDDINIYNYALSSPQIKQLYNQGSAVRFGPNEGSP